MSGGHVVFDDSQADAREHVDDVVRDPLLRRFAHGALHVRRHQRLYTVTAVWVAALFLFPVFRGADGASPEEATQTEAAVASVPEDQAPGAGEGQGGSPSFAGSTGGEDEDAVGTETAPSPALVDRTTPPSPAPARAPSTRDDDSTDEGTAADDPSPAPEPSPAPPPPGDDGSTDKCPPPEDDEGSGDPLAEVLGALGGDEEADETDDACGS